MNTIRSIRRIRRMIIVGAVLGVLSALLVAPASALPVLPLAFQLIANNGFEAGDPNAPIQDPWIFKYQSVDDKIVCLDAAPIGTLGDCAFQFKGGPGEQTKIMQKLNEGQLDAFDAQMFNGAQISFNYEYYSLSMSTSLSAKLVVKYTAPGFELPQKAKLTDTAIGNTASGPMFIWATEGPITTAVIPASANLTKVKAMIKNNSTSGFAYVDNINVVLTPNS